jgi:hypothetical protein
MPAEPRSRARAGRGLAPAAVLLVVALAALWLRPEGEPDQVLSNRFGDVVWNHGLHARARGSCRACHHEERRGTAMPRRCHECHPRKGSAEALVLAEFLGPREASAPEPFSAQEIFHARCRGCHQELGQGPVGCRDCHAQQYSGEHGLVRWDHLAHSRRMPGLGCGDCHHAAPGYEPKREAEYKGCRGCHPLRAGRPKLIEALADNHGGGQHGQCSFCHVEQDPEAGIVECGSCHPGAGGDGEAAGGLEDAVHRKCLACHNFNNPGRREQMPVRCNDCHRPSPAVLTGLSSGQLLWSHTRHRPEFNGGAWTCTTCHHKDLPDGPKLACAACHGAGDYRLPEKKMPGLDAAYKKRCIGCHKKEKAGPRRLETMTAATAPGVLVSEVGADRVVWDHRLHADSLGFSCRECHHNAVWQDGALRICPSAVACPEEEGIGSPRKCGNCHGETGAKPGSLVAGREVPPLADAFKQVCLQCHERLGAGPTRWDELAGRK